MVWLSVLLYICAVLFFGVEEIAVRIADLVPGMDMVGFVERHSGIFTTISNFSFAISSIIAAITAFLRILFEDNSFPDEDWIKIIATAVAVFSSGTLTIGHLLGFFLSFTVMMSSILLFAGRKELRSKFLSALIGGALLIIYLFFALSPFIYIFRSMPEAWYFLGEPVLTDPERPWLPAIWILVMMGCVIFTRRVNM